MRGWHVQYAFHLSNSDPQADPRPSLRDKTFGILAVSILGVANGKCKTLRDGETSVFLCEPETF